VVLQSALPDFFIAHSGLGRVEAASKTVSRTRSFRLTQAIGERFRNMPKVTIAKVEGRRMIGIGVDINDHMKTQDPKKAFGTRTSAAQF
jgi:hypothetical protein